MVFSPFDKRLLEEGANFFNQPRLACLLESLGNTTAERTAVLEAMLRNSCLEDLEEAVSLFERGLLRGARRRLRLEDRERRRAAHSGK
jgi:hypothetical protein